MRDEQCDPKIEREAVPDDLPPGTMDTTMMSVLKGEAVVVRRGQGREMSLMMTSPEGSTVMSVRGEEGVVARKG